MSPVPASRSRDRAARAASIPRRALLFPLVAGLCMIAAGFALAVQIVPEALAYRALAKGPDVHGTLVACRIEPLTRAVGRAVLTLSYLTPAGTLRMEAPTRHATCAQAFAEPRDHRVLYALDEPGLAVPFEAMPLRRYRVIATSVGTIALLLGGLWCVVWAVRRA